MADLREDSVDSSRGESFRSHICKDHSSYNYMVLCFLHSPPLTLRVDALMISFMTGPVRTQEPDSPVPVRIRRHTHTYEVIYPFL